jgi:hypothetical protein
VLLLARVDAAGEPVAASGTDGAAVVHVTAPPFSRANRGQPGSRELATGLTLRPVGKIVVVVQAETPQIATPGIVDVRDVDVLRFLPTGALDATFSPGTTDGAPAAIARLALSDGIIGPWSSPATVFGDPAYERIIVSVAQGHRLRRSRARRTRRGTGTTPTEPSMRPSEPAASRWPRSRTRRRRHVRRRAVGRRVRRGVRRRGKRRDFVVVGQTSTHSATNTFDALFVVVTADGRLDTSVGSGRAPRVDLGDRAYGQSSCAASSVGPRSTSPLRATGSYAPSRSASQVTDRSAGSTSRTSSTWCSA